MKGELGRKQRFNEKKQSEIAGLRATLKRRDEAIKRTLRTANYNSKIQVSGSGLTIDKQKKNFLNVQQIMDLFPPTSTTFNSETSRKNKLPLCDWQ